MQAFFQTRGRHTDYRFLGEEPADRWWTRYGRATSFEERTALLEAYAGRWQLYLSAIPSARRDRVNRPIRWTVVLEGPSDGPSGAALSLLRRWLDAPDQLGARLDEVLPEEKVEAILKGAGDAPRIEPATLRSEGDSALEDEAEDDGTSWTGGMHAPRGRRALMARAAALLRGRLEGTAAVLNLLGEPGEVDVSLSRGGTFAVLLESDTPELTRLWAQKKNQRISCPPGPPAPPASRPPPRSVPPPSGPGVAPPPALVDPAGGRAQAAMELMKSLAEELVSSSPSIELRIDLGPDRTIALDLHRTSPGIYVVYEATPRAWLGLGSSAVWTHLEEIGVLYPRDAPRLLDRILDAWKQGPSDDIATRIRELAQWIAACHAAAPAELRGKGTRGR